MMKAFLILLAALLLCGCQAEGPTASPSPTQATPAPAASHTPTASWSPSPSVPSSTPTRTPTGTPTPFSVCSPLEEETFDTLPLILVNPLKIPAFGRDDGHHGLDFAYFQRGERASIQGIEIYAILSGKTVLTLEDLIPYGYAVLIETPLEDLPLPLQETLLGTYQPIPENVVFQGECPAFPVPENPQTLSLYHLYAHMETQPPLQSGETITCGQRLGTVGNTGRSSNPHLHLETRLGPANLDLESMAFYAASYSTQQRAAYCLWRMSGYYQLFDPFLLFPAGE